MANLTFGKKKRRVNYDLLREVITWTVQIAIVSLLAFVCVWYMGRRVSVIGDSMNPKLENGNVALIDKVSYSMGAPGRGDVIAFKPNGNENAHCSIKRIVGLPGETVAVVDGKIQVDGREIKEKYATTELEELGLLSEPVKLKNNEYFVLGDNRTSSEDSRSADIGAVKRSEIEGKVWFVVSFGKTFGFVR